MSVAHRTLLLASVLGLWGCVHEPDAEPAHAPGDPILLPTWVDDARSQPKPPPSQTGTIVLGESQYEQGSGNTGSYGRSSVDFKFKPDAPMRGYGRGFYGPAVGARTTSGSVPPVGGNWPTIPNQGTSMPTTTPVHPR